MLLIETLILKAPRSQSSIIVAYTGTYMAVLFLCYIIVDLGA